MTEKEKIRVDKYLWAIRLYKTRSLAAEACEKGKVKLNGNNVKPAKAVSVGDEYEAKTENKKWLIKVIGIIDKRVPYIEAIKHYIDLTPIEELERIKFEAASFHTGKRLSKVGRPTKKDRRDIDDYMTDDEEG